MGHPRLLRPQVADADALLPAEVAAPVVGRAGADHAGQAVARVEDVVAVDEQTARLAVVGPDVQQVAAGIEHLDAAVAAVGDVDAPPRVHLDVVRIAEAGRLLALRADPAADRQQERAVGGELDDPVVAAAVPVRHPDVAAGSDHHAGRPVEVVLVVAPDAGLAQTHHHFAPLVELQHLVADAEPFARRRARVAVRSALGHPQEALVVQEEPVRETEEPGAEAVDQVAVEVELQDRVEAGPRALVRAATVQDPQVLAVRIGEDAAHRAQHAPLGHLLPAERGPVRVAGRRLGPEVRARRQQQPRQHDPRRRGARNRIPPTCVPHRILLSVRGAFRAAASVPRRPHRRPER